MIYLSTALPLNSKPAPVQKSNMKPKNPAPAELPQNASPAWDHFIRPPSVGNYLLA